MDSLTNQATREEQQRRFLDSESGSNLKAKINEVSVKLLPLVEKQVDQWKAEGRSEDEQKAELEKWLASHVDETFVLESAGAPAAEQIWERVQHDAGVESGSTTDVNIGHTQTSIDKQNGDAMAVTQENESSDPHLGISIEQQNGDPMAVVEENKSREEHGDEENNGMAVVDKGTSEVESRHSDRQCEGKEMAAEMATASANEQEDAVEEAPGNMEIVGDAKQSQDASLAEKDLKEETAASVPPDTGAPATEASPMQTDAKSPTEEDQPETAEGKVAEERTDKMASLPDPFTKKRKEDNVEARSSTRRRSSRIDVEKSGFRIGQIVAAWVIVDRAEDEDDELKEEEVLYIVRVDGYDKKAKMYTCVDPDPTDEDDVTAWQVPESNMIDYEKAAKGTEFNVGDNVYALYRERGRGKPSTEFYEAEITKISKDGRKYSLQYSDGDTGSMQLGEFFLKAEFKNRKSAASKPMKQKKRAVKAKEESQKVSTTPARGRKTSKETKLPSTGKRKRVAERSADRKPKQAPKKRKTTKKDRSPEATVTDEDSENEVRKERQQIDYTSSEEEEELPDLKLRRRVEYTPSDDEGNDAATGSEKKTQPNAYGNPPSSPMSELSELELSDDSSEDGASSD